PQRWNAYVYVLNCPTTLIDPDGKKPKRIIDIFLALETSKEDRAKFDKLRKEAAKQGVKINIFTMENKTATAENFIKSMQTKGRTTILVGHSMTSPESEKKMTNTSRYSGAAVGRFSDDSIISSQDNVEKGRATDTVDGTYAQAKNLAVFTCDFGPTFDKLSSASNTNFLSIDNGKDGFSSIAAGIEAGLSVTKVITNGGNAEQAQEAAQKVFDNSSNNYDKGDRVKLRVLKPIETEVP
ncbi:MAG: hypothetical protein LC778_09130, partial [Acidobacteria bacterium]|nr:hypothetical protein [Acidobacteriota bacterium]